MPRDDQDEWDIASSVGLTALAVAGGRAIESKRADALVTDPYADALVAAADADMPTPTRLPHPGYEHDAEFEGIWSQTATHMGIRTRFFDDFCADAWRDGVTQAVILASGLDARALRLDWPTNCTVFEIDQPRVLAFKSQVLAQENVDPPCLRREVPIDLRNDWATALQQTGFDRSRPCAWLVEGLLPYLPADAEARLLAGMHELSAPGSRIAVEHMRSLQALQDSTNGRWERIAERFGIDITDLFYDNETRPDPDEQLNKLGWHALATTGSELADRYGRGDDQLSEEITQQQRYITAQLVQ